MQANHTNFKGLAIVRNSDGLIRANNFDRLDEHYKQHLAQIIRSEGGITAESFPHKDPRFTGED